MNPSIHFRPLLIGACITLLAACATVPTVPPPQSPAIVCLDAARSKRVSPQERAALYLRAAAAAELMLGSGKEASEARGIYNAATEELTILLRSADDGQLWNKPLTLSDGSSTYQLRYQPGNDDGVWAPDYFTEFKPIKGIKQDLVKTPNTRAGVGGVLVGVRITDPVEKFSTKVGITGPVTPTLHFQGNTATLTLNDPTERSTVTLSGRRRPLAANFTAPLCYYPEVDATWLGLMEGLRPGKYEDLQGIYMLQPYNPDRIPVIFVHGLISTPYIWRDPINQIDEDPVLRANYQAIVYAYPTGNPAAFSAMKFREDLAEFEKTHPMPNGYILISHSLGGLLSQMQTETLDRDDWQRLYPGRADALFARVTPDSALSRALIFEANPEIKRVVFIATPHKGADLANASLGQLAIRLIRLPLTVTKTVTSALGNQLDYIVGNKSNRLPTSVSSLSPANPMLHVLATKEVVPPCHSIIGNRGKPGPLADSSDGVVPYWSSHLDYAESEVIVPGPHSCYDFPGAIAEMKRILHLHLKSIR